MHSSKGRNNRGDKREDRMIGVRRAALAVGAVALVAAAVVAIGSASPQQAGTVTIGWAFDGKGAMAPFDGPALATARDRVRQVNRGPGVNLEIKTCNTQGNVAATARS